MKVINCVVQERVKMRAAMVFSCITGALEKEKPKYQLSKLDRMRTDPYFTFRNVM